MAVQTQKVHLALNHRDAPFIHPRRGWGFLRALVHNPVTLAGLIIVIVILLAAIFASYLAPYDPNEANPRASLQAPSAEFWLGTDNLGRDTLSRLLYGARVSLLVGVISTFVAILVGTGTGAIAGYWGGSLDESIMRLLDIIMGFPAIVLAITLVSVAGPGLLNLIFIIGIIQLPHFARLTRGTILSLKTQEFILAARAIGQREWRIVVFHLLPNSITPIVVLASLSIAGAIITESALSFLGLGIRPPDASWGTILQNGQRYMLINPWVALFPGLAISITVLGFNLLGDGLRDALDPRTRGRG